MTATLDPPSGDLLALSSTVVGATAHVSTVGEVDSSSAPELRAELDRLLDGGARELVVDLTAVTFLDSAGLCVLAAVHRRAVADGVRLRVLASSRAVVRPMQITGLFDLLAVEVVQGAARPA
ncbi:STAS domain-containing protein [Geodermatophilus sp. SYSU D00815]